MDTLDERQTRLIEENNKIYKQSGEIKDNISKLRVEIESVDSNLQTTTQHRYAPNLHPSGIEPAPYSNSNSTQRDDAPVRPNFMANHPIGTILEDKTLSFHHFNSYTH